MILVADSGSSRTDWLLQTTLPEPLQFTTDGLNPYFLTEKEIAKIIYDQVPELVAYSNQITEIYFFGAGCSSPDRHEIVSNAICHLFPKAFVSVDSDLLASAYATCGHSKGYCCILGTGSNISFFDGEDISEGKHGLGFVLGDEGAGTWFGKALITDYLYNTMPQSAHNLFKEAYSLTKEDVIKHVYQQPGASAYLATFAIFLNQIRDTEYGNALINRGFLEFIESDIKTYPTYQAYLVHFVGSIAWHFGDELRALCAAHKIHVGKIIRKPINDLLQFILKRSASA